MSRRNEFETASCAGKLQYRDYSAAAHRVKRQRRRFKDKRHDEARVSVYRCPYCRGFHVGGSYERLIRS
jgi:hypothetical protein